MAKHRKQTQRRQKATSATLRTKTKGRRRHPATKARPAKKANAKTALSPKRATRLMRVGTADTATSAAYRAAAPMWEPAESTGKIREAVRAELVEAMLLMVQALTPQRLADSAPRLGSDGATSRAALDLRRAGATSTGPDAAPDKGMPSGSGGDDYVSAVEHLPQEDGKTREQSPDDGNAQDESFDARAREMFAQIEMRSQVGGTCTPLQILDFMIKKQAFGPETAIKTKDLPKARSTKRSRNRDFLEQIGALRPDKVTPIRTKTQGTVRPSKRRVDGVYLTDLAVRGWELRYGATVVSS
jgi:hypothetical protein